MSDPVQNSEIEDVLSSIRRLVSDNRPLETAPEDVSVTIEDQVAGPAVPAQDTVEADEEPLALVLTPALRVAEEGAEAEASQAEEADWAVSTEAQVTYSYSEDDAQGYDFGSTEVSEEDDPFAETQEAEPEEVNTEPSEEASTEDAFAHESQSLVSEKSDLDELAASFEDQSDEEAVPAETVDEEQPFDFKQVLEERIHQFRDAETVQEVAVSDTSADVAPEPEPAAMSEQDAPYMPEEVMQDLEERVREEAVQSTTLPGIEGLSEAMGEMAEIDEAMLREMVADIVRQELQGALGERITRNVRKLVRREIHRALAAHDLG